MLEMSCYSITTNKHRKKRKRKKIKTTIKDIPNLFYHTTKGISNPQHKKKTTHQQSTQQAKHANRRIDKQGDNRKWVSSKKGETIFLSNDLNLFTKK